MPTAILWMTMVAWLLLVGVGVTELVRTWRQAKRTVKPQ
jgi:ABC-type nickel/cobalt efflux system permease component RcnA